MYVPFSFISVRYSRIFSGTGCSGASSSSVSASVDGPVFVLRITGKASLPNSTSPSCLFELMLKVCPARAWISFSSTISDAPTSWPSDRM
jgi:hypothetical protein